MLPCGTNQARQHKLEEMPVPFQMFEDCGWHFDSAQEPGVMLVNIHQHVRNRKQMT